MTIGPHIGHWVAGHSDIPYFLPHLWPYIHCVIAVSFTIVAVETLYFMAPDVKQRFLATLPGATVAVIAWVALTYLMGVYFRSFAHFGNTYGILRGCRRDYGMALLDSLRSLGWRAVQFRTRTSPG